METWESVLISPEATILDAIKIIDNTQLLIAVVVTRNKRLLGTVTDGDVRRAILRNEPMSTPVEKIMSIRPISAPINATNESILNLIQMTGCRQIPLVDNSGRVVDVKKSIEFFHPNHYSIDSPVLIMAGGLGSRLRPLTYDCPKPLLNIGNKPILEIILENFIEYSFQNFYISINYKGEMIEDYFENGDKWGVNIQYLKEKKRMGTAGALSLIKDKLSDAIIVMNGDLLTKVNFEQLLTFHKESKAKATLCVRDYDYQVPFGVVKVNGCQLQSFKEKPIERHFINAGIYVLEPEALDLIPNNKFFDMPDLLNYLLKKNEKPSVFPIREYWRDIGQLADYQLANEEYMEFMNDVEIPAI